MGQIVSGIVRCADRDNRGDGPPPAHRYYHSSGSNGFGIGNVLQLQKDQNHVTLRDTCSSYHIRIDSSPRNGAETFLQRKEEDQWIINKAVLVRRKEQEIVRLNHYSNCQRILLVGEGDFSFSASLAVAFGSASNIIATSLDSAGFLSENYKNAMANIQSLTSRGAKVMHGVDATIMSGHFNLTGIKFDRIIFNFPHDGFNQNEPRESQLRRHRKLIQGFLANAKKMIKKNGGEIHISHKSNGFHLEWNLEGLALKEGLQLVNVVNFNFRDYPGYRTKYGFGGDKNFNCYPSMTYMFAVM